MRNPGQLVIMVASPNTTTVRKVISTRSNWDWCSLPWNNRKKMNRLLKIVSLTPPRSTLTTAAATGSPTGSSDRKDRGDTSVPSKGGMKAQSACWCPTQGLITSTHFNRIFFRVHQNSWKGSYWNCCFSFWITILHSSSQQLPRHCLGTLKGFLSWHSALLGPSTHLMCCFQNYRDTRTPSGVPH